MLILLILSWIGVSGFGAADESLSPDGKSGPAISGSTGQERSEVIFSGHAPSGEFYADHMDNIYFIDGHKIIKVETGTGESYEYGSLSDGAISGADVSNPLQIMLFYRNFNRVLFLDNKLAHLRSPVDLADLGIEQAILACSSGRGGFWIFSDRSNKLVYFDRQLLNTHQSLMLSSIISGNVKPVYMTEAGNMVFLNVPRKGILVFDRFASYLTTVPYKGPDKFQVLDGKIIYYTGSELQSLDMEGLEVEVIGLPEGSKAENVQIRSGRIYILSGNTITVYSPRP